MNRCVLMGKLEEQVNFEFLYNSKYVSISTVKMKLLNNSMIILYGLDNMADYMYKNLNKGQSVGIYGSLDIIDENIRIRVIEIEILNSK